MNSQTGWHSLEEMAAYLSMGKTALYELARGGRIPARKVGKKWIFDKVSVDTWVRANQPLKSCFMNI